MTAPTTSDRPSHTSDFLDDASRVVDEVGDRIQAPVREHAETVQRLGRVGWVAKGILYLALALMVWQLARQGGSSESADQQGALAELAGEGAGTWLIAAIAVGLFLYAAARLVEALLASSEKAVDRAGAAVSGVIHTFLGVLATQLALDGETGGGGSGSGGGSTDSQAAGLLGSTAGRLLIGVVGVVLLGVAVEQARRAVNASFMRRIDSTDFRHERSAIEVLGRVGHAARAVVYAITGGFLTVAAIQADADDAKGLDGSLQEVAGHAWGDTLLAVTAVGLAVYGLFCIVSSRHQVLVRH